MSRWFCFLAVVSAFLFLQLCAAAESEAPTEANHRLIIQFTNYIRVEDVDAFLSLSLGGAMYRMVPLGRHNKKTDFAVIETGLSAEEARVQWACPGIRWIAPDQLLHNAEEFVSEVGNSVDASSEGIDEENMGSTTDIGARKAFDLGDLFGNGKAGGVVRMLNADVLWELGYRGKGVKVAVFDSGVAPWMKVENCIDWTEDGTCEDKVGHGTFVAGVIGTGRDPNCHGIAPKAEIHMYKVFSQRKSAYTSWFLDAFNHAMEHGMHVINLSVGGPDHMDWPFVEKVSEAVGSAGIIVVSAAGNDGPSYGSLNNPGDQNEAISIGAIDEKGRIATFSSRGMTTWEIPWGMGRVKPDVVTYGVDVRVPAVSSPQGGCDARSGTSVACPVATGTIALLLSAVKGSDVDNPGVIRQVLMEGADRLDVSKGYDMFAQGKGKLNILNSFLLLAKYQGGATTSPDVISNTAPHCPYMGVYCDMPLFASRLPVVYNISLVIAGQPHSRISRRPMFKALNVEIIHGHLPSDFDIDRILEVTFTHPDVLYPYSGWLGVSVSVRDGDNLRDVEAIVTGEVVLALYPRIPVTIPVRLKIIPKPPRSRRVLLDVLHSISYPAAFVPRDNLRAYEHPLDLHGDHPFTNYREFVAHLYRSGYHVEVLAKHFSSIPLKTYGSLIISDPEDVFLDSEIEALWTHVANDGLSLLVFAGWYDKDVMNKMMFTDSSTHKVWKPVTGGCNIPQLNRLLAPGGISFGKGIYEGKMSFSWGRTLHFNSGSPIGKFPRGSMVVPFDLFDMRKSILEKKQETVSNVYAMGITPRASDRGGHAVVVGSSTCLDSVHNPGDCFWLVSELLRFTADSHLDPSLYEDAVLLDEDYVWDGPMHDDQDVGLSHMDASNAIHLNEDESSSPRWVPLLNLTRIINYQHMEFMSLDIGSGPAYRSMLWLWAGGSVPLVIACVVLYFLWTKVKRTRRRSAISPHAAPSSTWSSP
eukprot:TRINITY_DN66_c1_g3_i1.p1 TRINITY_DN66_c1_g3~~TRINITY_DN66_c1_g3_i1.p1  ORF type:complete len:978 (-),score=219.02 TRINITY_DN66_c1_g3_i1:150-3083(-)